MTTKLLTLKIPFVGLRSSAERLGIPGFALDAEIEAAGSNIFFPKIGRLVDTKGVN